MNVEFSISPDHPALAGHFPGNPIVPAVVIIQAVARRIEEATGTRIDEVRQLRLQQPLLPGQPVIMMISSRSPGAWRVTLKAGDSLIAKGTFGQRNEILPAPGAGQAGTREQWSGADAYRVLPHSENMALIDTFETDASGWAYTSVSPVSEHPLVENGGLAPWVALEYAAQLYGCCKLTGATASPSENSMDRAFIVMVKSMQVDADQSLDSGRTELALQVVSEQGNAAQCEFEARADGQAQCRGEFTVVSYQ